MSQPPEEDPSAEALDLMKSLVGLLDEKWVTRTALLKIASDHDLDNIQARIVLLTGLKTLARHLPMEVFSDDDARDRLLMAVQEALDQTILEEDAQT